MPDADGGPVERCEENEMHTAAAGVAALLLPLNNAQRWRVIAAAVTLYGVRPQPSAAERMLALLEKDGSP